MPDGKLAAAKAAPFAGEDERLSLQRAFETFQRQSEMLEKSHSDLKARLLEAQLDLAEKNRQLARSVEEVLAMKGKLAGILESINDAVLLVGPDGRIDVSNEAGRQFLAGCGRPEAGSAAGIPELDAALSAKGPGPLRSALVEFKSSGGRRRYMLSAIPMRGGGGGTVLSLRDVSELMDLQERVGREDRLAALGKVAASVAHEIRNPLGAIEGFGMLLERDLKGSPELQRLASKTVYAARQLNSVVSNLLSYTREIRVELSPCSVKALVEDALEFARPLAEDRKVSIEAGSRCDAGLSVMADAGQVRQVLINVLMNAVEACPHRGGGLLLVAWGPCGDGFAAIEVSDNGSGVPESLKKRIFEPFFTTKDGGTGLGLSLCQRIIEAHGGEISEAGEEGQGARFSIKLKLVGART